MLMAEIERTEHGDSGRARAWTLRAVRALHDPVWTADGYVSASWRPVSPVSGRIDAFQWQTPLAALPSDKSAAVEASPFEEAMLAPPPRRVEPSGDLATANLESDAKSETASDVKNEAPRDVTPPVAIEHIPAAQDNSPAPVAVIEPAPARRAVTAAGRILGGHGRAAVPSAQPISQRIRPRAYRPAFRQ